VLSAADPQEEQSCRTAPGRAPPIERAGLYRDDDGDEAHEFWEEDPRSGTLRPVAAADLKHVDGTKPRR